MADTDYTQYGVLAANQITANSGTTTVLGDLGSDLAVNGSGSVNVSSQTNIGNISDALINAQGDYASFISLTPGTTSSASDIGGLTFTPDIIQFTHSGDITLGSVSGNNTFTLNGSGVYFLQFPNGGLVTQTSLAPVSINMINGAKPSQIFWLINGSFTAGSTGSNKTNFAGTVICQGDITLGTGCNSIGSLCASNSGGNIILNSNKVVATAVQRPRDMFSTAYINIETTLPDSPSIIISASSPTGGISMDAGENINIGAGPTGLNINIGTSTIAKTIKLGNNASSSRILVRHGAGGNVKHQEPETALSDADATLTIAQLLIALFTITPATLPRTLTLPTAANAVAGITEIAVNDEIDFSILNLGVSPAVSVAAGTGGTLVGSGNVIATTSSIFRLRFTNVSSGSETYTVYRIA